MKDNIESFETAKVRHRRRDHRRGTTADDPTHADAGPGTPPARKASRRHLPCMPS
jgi:hypothetical protein